MKGLETLSLGPMSAEPPAERCQGVSGEKEDKEHEIIHVALFGCWSGGRMYPA